LKPRCMSCPFCPGDDEIAFVIRRSSPLVAAYRHLFVEFQVKPSAQRRLREILARVQAAMPATKKGGVGHEQTPSNPDVAL
jgi:hypothetical protein